jgi:NAD(P)-dependent dehydrogenase (short-subunit alcohol dehydrogenase family)
MQDLSARVAVVTGAAGNLGRAVAAAFEAAGVRLVLVDRSEEALGNIYGEGLTRLPVVADLTSEDSVAGAVARAVEHYGRIDILANIAGGFRMGPPVHETPVETWDLMLAMNAKSAFLMSRAVIPHMLANAWGRIINVSARAAVQPKGWVVPYCVSKAAVITFTEGLAAEHRTDGITVNCVLPGTLDTPQNRADMPDADWGRWVAPAALADVIRFLCSDAAHAVSGAAIPVYGQS